MEFLEVIFILLIVYISFKLGFRKINHKIPEIPLPPKKIRNIPLKLGQILGLKKEN